MLEYGAGPGRTTPEYVRRGALRVVGFDVSEAEVEEANRNAELAGVADRLHHVVADGHATGFEDDSFDLIVGGSILHHLDLELALREIRRILRPGGRAVFHEPLAQHPLLRLGRRLTPTARTPDEHPLTPGDWELCRTVFPGFWHREVEFLSVPLLPLGLILPRRWQSRFADRVKAGDDRVLQRWPTLRPYARLTFLVLE